MLDMRYADWGGSERDAIKAEMPEAAPDHIDSEPMTRAQWMRWAFMHTDHHLRQFGL